MGVSPPLEPSAAMLNLSALAYLLGITVVTWCITRSTEPCPIWLKKTWSTMPWARLCLLLVLIDSWLYLFFSGMLLYGAPPQHGADRCSVGMIACVLLYGGSKALIYLCLIERVHAVWSSGQQRRRSPLYIFCLVLMLPLGAIAGIMIWQGVRYVHNGHCIIGISRLASALLTSYDAVTNLFLTVMFVAPLVRSTIRSPWLKTLAIRASVATSIALMTTVINGIVLFVLEGQEMIWVCFGACAADMTANVVVLYWAMQGPGSSSDARGQSIHFSPIPQTHDAPPCTFNVEHSLETGTVQSNSVYFTTLPNYAQPQEDSLSQGKTIPSSICVSTFEKPKPALQSPYYAARLGQHPQECRLSMPVTTEQFVEPSDSQHTSNSTQGRMLVQEIGNDSEIYDSSLERMNSTKSRQSPITPPSQ